MIIYAHIKTTKCKTEIHEKNILTATFGIDDHLKMSAFME